MSSLKYQRLQGEMHLQCDGMFIDSFAANILLIVPLKEF